MPLPLISRFIFDRFAAPLAHLASLWRLREQVRNERKALAKLSDRMLVDIGVSREDATREAARQSWDLPKSRVPSTDCNANKSRTGLLLTMRLG